MYIRKSRVGMEIDSLRRSSIVACDDCASKDSIKSIGP